TSDAVVALPGKYGTLSEMAFALQAGKPLVSVSAWKLGDEIHHVESPEEAAHLVMELVTETK
ncbi:MAG: TIGR00725 family protein, partial [Candidatus Zixiibacteriota bacterium]